MTARPDEVVAYQVGGWYQQQDGAWVQFVGVADEGTHYESMYSLGADGRHIHRYTRRDLGRITGSAHDYTDQRNTPPLVPLAALQSANARLAWMIDQCAVVKTDGFGSWFVVLEWLSPEFQYESADSQLGAIDVAMKAEAIRRAAAGEGDANQGDGE